MINEKIEAQVARSMGIRRWRKGRGFSIKEIREAGVTLHEVKMLKLPIDKRRGTLHNVNVQLLRRHCTVIPLTDIKGIGREIALELKEAGITSVQDLMYWDVNVLSEKIRPSVKTLRKWQLEAQRLVKKL
jgi:large subunit ribosomal protein L13e